MREFVVFAVKASTSPDFYLDDLPGSGGRMDLVARCICNALWISHGLRRDSCIHIVAGGKPNPPVIVSFYGSSLKDVSPDERNIAAWIKKSLASKSKRKNPGIIVCKGSFQSLIEELAGRGRFFYILHEKGTNISDVEVKENTAFVLGDHIGLPEKEEKFVEGFEHEKVSLGSLSYLASQCITMLHYELDKKQRKSTRLCSGRDLNPSLRLERPK